MNFNGPEQGEALVGAFEIMADRIAQVVDSVAWIDQVVEAPEQNHTTNNVASLMIEKTAENQDWAA